MKQLFGKIGTNLKAAVLAGSTALFVLLLPIAATAQDAARLGGSFGVANVTNGDTTYKDAVNAAQGQTVKVQLYYVNNEAANSDKTAQNVRLKLTMPTSGGKAQVIRSSIKGDNTDPFDKQVTINTDRDDAVLQYIPGTAVWKHNTGTAEAPKIEETKLSDDVVTGAQGIVLETQKPGEAYGATVSVLAKVSVPGVVVTSQSQLKGQTGQWSGSNTAKPGDTMRYLISYQNSGSDAQRKVMVRTTLPVGAQIVPGTTMLTNAVTPAGAKFDSDSVSTTGIDIGNYGAGANAFVSFEAKLPAAERLKCGANELRNVATVKPENLNEYYGSSVTIVTRECAPTPPVTPTPPTNPTPPATPPTSPTPPATYNCTGLEVAKSDGRKINATLKYAVTGNAKLKSVTYNFGDGSNTMTTDKTTVSHTFAKDGEYTVSARVVFTVDGKDQTVANNACSQVVSFVTPATPAAPSPPATTPVALPSTGTGEVFGLFAVVAIAGTIGHRLFLTRRLS